MAPAGGLAEWPKKQLIPMAPFLAAARQPKRMTEKIAAQRLFLLLRNKKQLISMVSFLAAARQPKRMAKKIAAQRLFFIAPQ